MSKMSEARNTESIPPYDGVMNSGMPRLHDLVTVLYQPRETMRRILAYRHRWAAEIVILACICSSMPDKDVRNLDRVLPDLHLGSVLALAALGVVLGCLLWLLFGYLFAWMVTVAGRRIGGTGEVADVRAALAWSLVPLIWAVVYRIPMALYLRGKFAGMEMEGGQQVVEFVKQGGCTLAVVAIVLKIALFVWMLFIASVAVGEAQRFSGGEGLGAIAIAAAAPVVIGIAAVLAFRA